MNLTELCVIFTNYCVKFADKIVNFTLSSANSTYRLKCIKLKVVKSTTDLRFSGDSLLYGKNIHL